MENYSKTGDYSRWGEHDVIDKYAKLKSAYGRDILIDVDVINVDGGDHKKIINDLTWIITFTVSLFSCHFRIKSKTDEVLSSVTPEKDIDGLVDDLPFIPATAMAIDWLLAGYNVDLFDKKIAIVGKLPR